MLHHNIALSFGVNMQDVLNVINSIQTQLIVIGVALVVAIVVIIAAMKIPKPLRGLIRGEACVAWLLVTLIMVNMMCTGPLSTMLDLISETSYLNDETTAAATELVSEITEEGVVLAKNVDGILPIVSGSKLNVFGWASTNPCYGGTGSGALNDAYPTVDILEGLKRAGIETNTELSQFYVDYLATRPTVGMWAQDWTIPEPAASTYPQFLIDNAKSFSDTAMIVITRVGGEGADLPTDMVAVVNGTWSKQTANTYYAGTYDNSLNEGDDWDAGDHFLQLTNQEEAMVDLVCSNFDNVVVVYNGANAFELGWVNDHPQIKGVLLCPGTGQSGFEGFGRVVSGAVNPSGKTVDTYVYNLKDTPYWNNIGCFVYDNMDEFSVVSVPFGSSEETVDPVTFVNYVEGIYVGYKFYETAADEGMTGFDYDKTVLYPFGYGLSYTDFDVYMNEIGGATPPGQVSVSTDGKDIGFSVTVTNTGSVAGKEVIEVYFTPPYTNGGIEKASVNLLDFAKTKLLQPGETVQIGFEIPMEQLASYDDTGAGCYVLEKGEYTISVRSDSHTVLDSQTFTVDSTITYGASSKRDSDKIPAVNQFDYARGDVTYLSRTDGFANYTAATAAPSSYSMSAEAKSNFYNISNYLTAETTAADEAANGFSDAAITTGTDDTRGSILLKELRGLEYDDPKWDEYLDTLTLGDYNALISLGGYQTNGITEVGKIRTNDNDGPASINNNFTGVGSVGFPAAVLIANTWNDDLAYKFGDSIGTMGNEMNTSGWYGPAMNIHRSAFAGRNFEYYSEDGVLSGSMAANAIKGAQEHGVYAYMKHFALNDQEANRCSQLCTWSTEQAMREIYLRPFEISVKEGDSLAVMSSFNYIGNRWAGGTYQLQTTVLRDEWGFRGFVETDYFGVYGYMSSDQAIRNGTDLMLVNYPTATNNVQFQSTNAAQQAMRQSAHRILYVVVNSRAYTDENYAKASGTPIWRTILTVVNVVVVIIAIAIEVLLIKGYLGKKKNG